MTKSYTWISSTTWFDLYLNRFLARKMKNPRIWTNETMNEWNRDFQPSNKSQDGSRMISVWKRIKETTVMKETWSMESDLTFLWRRSFSIISQRHRLRSFGALSFAWFNIQNSLNISFRSAFIRRQFDVSYHCQSGSPLIELLIRSISNRSYNLRIANCTTETENEMIFRGRTRNG